MRQSSAAVLLACVCVAPAAAENVSPWARDGSSALRLVDGGPATAPGARLAAIAIELDPGWKTYWRQPGASGVPPRFDFSGSINLAEARVAYPVPERSEDGDGVTNVYHGRVVLPVTVTPKDPSKPVDLKLVADYGICEAVCVPVRAEAEIELEPGEAIAGVAADEARRAAVATPRPLGLGAEGALSVTSVRRVAGDTDAELEIAVAAPGDAPPLLFAETGEGDYAPSPKLAVPPSGGRATFRMRFDEPELPKSGLKLTLSSGAQAIETPVALDAIGGPS